MWGRRTKYIFQLDKIQWTQNHLLKWLLFLLHCMRDAHWMKNTAWQLAWISLHYMHCGWVDKVECKKTATMGGGQYDSLPVIMCRTVCDLSILFHSSVYICLCKYHNVLIIKSGNIRPVASFFSKTVLVKVLDPFCFHTNFCIGLSITTQKHFGILFEIALVWFSSYK